MDLKRWAGAYVAVLRKGWSVATLVACVGVDLKKLGGCLLLYCNTEGLVVCLFGVRVCVCCLLERAPKKQQNKQRITRYRLSYC